MSGALGGDHDSVDHAISDILNKVLYHIFVSLTEVGTDDVLRVDILNAFGSFVLITTFSILTGMFFGIVAVLLTRISDHVPVVQPLFVVVFGYIAYIFAEMFHLSGILSCALCGMTMRKYVKANMSKKSHTTTRYFLKLLASIGETVTFIYLGIVTVISIHQWNSSFCLLTLVFCLVLRVGVLLILTVVINCGRLPKLTLVDQFVLSYGGLRGTIAFSLLLSLDEDLFPMKRMYFTATVLVILFTNFIMGSTIKPLVKALKGKKTEVIKSSLNDQIQERLIDHLMAGIEDIAGHHGHHKLRDKFEYLDKHYLQKAFVRRSHITKNGWSAVSNYDKLSVNEAHELEQNTDYSAMLRQLQPENGMIRNFSFMRWLSSVSHGCFPYGYPPFTMSGMKSNDQAEQTLVDLQVMEAQNTRKMRDDSKVHHIIEDSMFVPRKRFLGHPRHTVPPDSYSHVQLHHKARLHLRHLMSHHHRHSDTNHHNTISSVRNNGHNNRPKKNVSFAEVTQVTKDDGEADVGSTHAESGLSGEESDSDDIGGITFTAISLEDIVTQSDIPVEPVAVEMSLPWKRNTGRDPMPSAMKHSMPDDQNPLIGEAPSWVANTEYTSPGSPPVTPQTQHQMLTQSAPSQTSSSERDQIMSERLLDEPDSSSVDRELDLIQFNTPDHKPAIPHNRDIRDEEEDDNHERTAECEMAGSEASHNNHESLSCDLVTASPQDIIQAEPAVNTTTKLPSAFTEEDPQYSPFSLHSDVQNVEPSSTTGPIDIPSSARRSDINSHSAPVSSPARALLPWRQNSYNSDAHPLPWRENAVKETDYRLPWRQSSLDSADENSVSMAITSRPGNQNDRDDDSDCYLPPPWLDNKGSPTSAKDKGILGDDSSQTSRLPWRDNSNVEVKLDQCAPRPRHVPTPPEEEEVSHIPPPPWRHNPEPDSSVRSPSASCEVDLYSLRPQLSSHSFRISEAESKHSEPVHVHHMIEVPQPRPHIEFDCESSHSLDLESEEVTLNDRIAHWLDMCDPQPLEDDLQDLADVVCTPNTSHLPPTCGSIVISGDGKTPNGDQAESVV
ncbi:hypothetical protein LSH36_101g05046 [Paralvinella palmiformis]|uniref:Sodium/hydrogen exchanger n=1 Tax=Paralvinella palmiformis TaxID=53620 RepID=A0AAD9JZB2_9ANNE|nr:hypothetical protein LSH36_101g05046 [Paralvinella palmiformis]